MKPGPSARLALALALGSVPIAGPARGADVVSPVYKNWERFPERTTTRYRQVSEIGTTRYESTITYTLIRRTRDKVVVEMQVTTMANGTLTTNRPMQMDNPRAINLPPGVKAEAMGKPDGLIAEGEEDLKVAGLDLKKVKWYEAKTKVERGDTITRSWSSGEVPGGLVKSVSTTPVTKSSMTMELVEVKTP